MNDSPLFEAWQAVRLVENAAVTAFHDAMKNGNRDMPPLEAVTMLSAPIIPPHGHVGYR